MDKKIEDYLHLYLGCELFTGTGKVKLIAIQIEVIPCSTYRIICLNGNQIHETIDVKPILRALSDMTEEEMKELYKLVFKKDFGRNGDIRFYDSLSQDSKPNDISRWVLWSGVERLGIQFDGRIWADSDLQIYSYNQHEVTRWLLAKHFDLFDLVESGLAIDKKTLK